MTAHKSDAKGSDAKKRRYRTPRLVRYGTIVELTHSTLAASGPNDTVVIKKLGFYKSV